MSTSDRLAPADSVGSPRPDDTGRATSAGTVTRSLEHAGVVKVALACTYLACFTTPWTAIGLGSLRLGDLFLLLAVIVFFAADINARLPRFPEWVWIFAGTIVLIGVLHEILPTADSYLANRISPYAEGLYPSRGVPAPFTNLGVMIKFLVPIVGLPLVFGLAHAADSRALRRSAIAFAAGAAISGLIAFTDVEGLTRIAIQVSGITADGGRGAGLTEHPNYVAMGSVFGLPILIWQTLSPRGRDRLLALVGVAGLLLGIYASGSRSGGGAGAIAFVLAFVLIPGFRRSLPIVGLLGGLILGAAFVAYPALGDGVLKALRLTGDAGEGSDLARSVVNGQGEADFAHSPIYGVGLQVASEAHIVYLQALAAGGVILLTGYVIFLLGALTRSYRAIRIDDVAAPLFVSILGGTIFNAAQDALTLRIVYVPAAIAATLPVVSAWAARRGPDVGGEGSAGHTAVDRRVELLEGSEPIPQRIGRATQDR